MVAPHASSKSARGRRGRPKRDAVLPEEVRREHAIHAAMGAYRRTFGVLHKITRTASSGEIKLADAFLLHFIGIHGEQTPKRIAAFTGLTSGSVTSMLDRLERAGLTRRERSTTDRRVVLVSLTSKSRERLEEAIGRAHADADRFFRGWATKDIETFARLLGKFGSAGLDETR